VTKNEIKSRSDQNVTIRKKSALSTERKMNRYTLDKQKNPLYIKGFQRFRGMVRSAGFEPAHPMGTTPSLSPNTFRLLPRVPESLLLFGSRAFCFTDRFPLFPSIFSSFSGLLNYYSPDCIYHPSILLSSIPFYLN
jgi:hypothetical protein